ncbi:MAG: rubredoxin, partial [Bacteroidota bacterium]
SKTMAKFPELQLEDISQSKTANIVSSYVAADIFASTAWLTSATYLYILEQFRFQPRLEINITDPRQRLTPLFSGHLNFIASPKEDFWYLYVKLPGWQEMEPFPAYVHSWDIAALAAAVHEKGNDIETMEDFVAQANAGQDLNLQSIEEHLTIPFYPFPYYEGMNRLDAAHYWLGLYWRNNWYDLDFLEATCKLCMEHRIGKICITSWKSFIINGIPEQKRIEWEKLLGRFGINARHSSLELNWHLPVADREALELKRYLIREFDQRDISTYGLTFAISSNYTRPFTSIVIDREQTAAFVDGFAVRPTYNLRYARNFDPNTRHYVEYARQVDKSELITLMLELSRLYFEQLNERRGELVEATDNREPEPEPINFYQCSHCQSVYDPAVGDPSQGITAGTPFSALPEDYACWLCGGPKLAFVEAELVIA